MVIGEERSCNAVTVYPGIWRVEGLNNRLQLNPTKTEWLGVLGSRDARNMFSLVLNGVALLQTDQVSNLGSLPQLIVPPQTVPIVTRRSFVHIHVVCQLRMFLDHSSHIVIQTLVTTRLGCYNVFYIELPLKSIWNLES